jgi:hypothetical protein
MVTMSVFYNAGQLVEQRHNYGNEVHGEPITGQIIAIEWRQVDDVGQLVEGSPCVAVTSTDDRPDGHSWAFDFTVVTEDPIPRPL